MAGVVADNQICGQPDCSALTSPGRSTSAIEILEPKEIRLGMMGQVDPLLSFPNF